MAALGLQRAPRWFRGPFDGLTYVSIIVPEIVIALATLVFFSTSFDSPEPDHRVQAQARLPDDHRRALPVQHQPRLLLIQARLNGMDRTHVEASYDLYGTPWRTFWQITFPQLLPAIVAGFLLWFTFSFDDYVITTFVSGAGNDDAAAVRLRADQKGVTPATNAVAAVMLLITLGDPAHRPVPRQPQREAPRDRRLDGVDGRRPLTEVTDGYRRTAGPARHRP